ncbi:uncharacterized protein LOC114962937 [Acropora millepora]|uniref:uncharacterized protein LOC114962937 n=1 Tax=Acropora millepora TaxID=45264 RepID=UPI001CF3C3F3|nr:uncharacterized protein LOC114962937 [Acropora millepora]
MEKNRISYIAVFSIAMLVVVACVVIVLQKGRSTSTEAPKQKAKFSKEQALGSTKRPEAGNSTGKIHHWKFCRQCCQTPPCWYKNHEKCNKCLGKKTKKNVSRLLRISHNKSKTIATIKSKKSGKRKITEKALKS